MSDYEGDERRDHPRVPIDGQLQGEIEASVVAPLMDLSLSGALIEVPSALPANARYALKLPMSVTDSVEIQVEVVRSYVHGFDSVSAGKPAVKYRAAIRFVDLSDVQRMSLKQLMDRGSGDPIQVELSS
ncbi:MAG: hypothetical protein BMS9Abin37_2825 [Acidobacteriota bacterium]|nr:MAG: hypothetical protein BMS9Abin37_2825 [Acidobacteriota bacterium]